MGGSTVLYHCLLSYATFAWLRWLIVLYQAKKMLQIYVKHLFVWVIFKAFTSKSRVRLWGDLLKSVPGVSAWHEKTCVLGGTNPKILLQTHNYLVIYGNKHAGQALRASWRSWNSFKFFSMSPNFSVGHALTFFFLQSDCFIF